MSCCFSVLPQNSKIAFPKNMKQNILLEMSIAVFFLSSQLISYLLQEKKASKATHSDFDNSVFDI